MEQDIKDQIAQLADQIKKNTKALAQTGQLVLDLQLESQRREVDNLSIKDKQLREDAGLDTKERLSQKQEHQSKAVTESDLFELVNELQGQLDVLDERSIRRTSNAFVADDADAVAPLPNREGQYPAADELQFPKNLREFKDLTCSFLHYWLRWYELLPPDQEELEKIFDGMGASIEDLHSEIPPETEITDEEIDRRYDLLSRFIGLRHRRTPGAW